MGYRVEGDGTKYGTKIWKDGVPVENWGLCIVNVWKDGCVSYVDGDVAHLDRIALLGVYKLIGDGSFSNTKLFINDEELRGVTALELRITYPAATMYITTTFLPHIIEGEDNNGRE